MQHIAHTYRIEAPLASVWRALVDPEIIDEWGGGPAEMNEDVGAAFSLWGGDVHGTNTAVIPNSKLAQDWYSDGWEKPSHVVFTLSAEGEMTTVDLVHDDVPAADAKDIAQGWKDYYFGPMQEFLEN